MENLWAPWRMAYIKQLDQPAGPHEAGAARAAPPCFLCQAAKAQLPLPSEGEGRGEGGRSPDAQRMLVLQSDARGVILLNRYPYTSGHLLIAPAQHVAELADLTPTQRADLMELTTQADGLLRLATNPQGINIGLNLGRCAGAGLPGHLHVHVVPRWNGDTNFLQTVGQVRVIPEALEATYELLTQTLAKLKT
ncbi:MAG: HIT domain-containing protein [Phycisphaeraceae bacterium]